MKPILFNTEMTRAILEGRKTVTRRVVKEPGWKILGRPKWGDKDGYGFWFNVTDGRCATSKLIYPLYQPFEVMYVRETFVENKIDPDGPAYYYKADYSDYDGKALVWRPSIHMPKEAARIFLRVTGVRVERLQDVDHAGITKEGIVTKESPGNPNRINPFCKFKNLWNSTIKPADRAMYGWDANPWVFVIDFERISKENVQL